MKKKIKGFSSYKYIKSLSPSAALVRNKKTGQLCVYKERRDCGRDVYDFLLESRDPYFPRIESIRETKDALLILEEYIPGISPEQLIRTKKHRENASAEECAASKEAEIPGKWEPYHEDGSIGIRKPRRESRVLANIVTMEEWKVTEIAIQVVEALKILHSQDPPIIHRDLKPANLIITAEGSVKLIDFDTARRHNLANQRDTKILGTRSFAAPEQFGYAQTDGRSDIYALGVTMYALLHGKFPGDESENPPTDTGKGEWEGLDRIIKKCIRFDPKHRYADADTLAAELMAEKIRIEDESSAHKAADLGEIVLRKIAGAGRVDECREEGRGKIHSEPDFAGRGAVRSPKEKHRKRLFVPPGFRSGKIWKMITAAAVYAAILGLLLTLEIDTAYGDALTGVALWGERICLVLTVFCWIFFIFDYANIHRLLPLMHGGKYKRIVGYVVYICLIALVFSLIVLVIDWTFLNI